MIRILLSTRLGERRMTQSETCTCNRDSLPDHQ